MGLALLLIGGSALVLMLIIGGLIGVIMFAENADNILAEARSAMTEGAYGNAIQKYEEFVEDYPGNAEFSAARVELAMARIRQTLESSNFQLAFDTSQTELSSIADESEFSRAEADLSDLLPRIARGLADQAEASENPNETSGLFDKATTALGMANNTKYISKSRRDTAELQEIRETLDRIQRRQQSLADLEATLATIGGRIAEGDTNAAFQAQEQLVDKHPSLIGNARLSEAVQQISIAEQANIAFVAEPIQASSGGAPKRRCSQARCGQPAADRQCTCERSVLHAGWRSNLRTRCQYRRRAVATLRGTGRGADISVGD